MLDSFNREISYLRISVTDRCNLRCIYCMPENGVKLLPHNSILSFEEIAEVVKTGVKYGIRKVRLTGGEPLVRRNIVNLVEQLAAISGIEDLSMTTNGLLLNELAADLAKAGLKRINISLDTTDAHQFKTITRTGDLSTVFKGIEAAKAAGLTPIKINCVIHENRNEANALLVKAFCESNGYHIRYIHQMSLSDGTFKTVEGGEGGNCKICNRLRLTANGKLKPCLFNDTEYDVRELGPERAFQLAVSNKPECGSANHTNHFSNIGG